MAGTARMVPAMMPFTTSCPTSASEGIRSGDLQQHELPVGDLVVAELAIDDVADVGEVAGSARALVVDLGARSDQLQSFDRAIDLLPVTLADLAHVVADAGAGCNLRLGDRERDQAGPIRRLRLVGIRLGDAEALLRE